MYEVRFSRYDLESERALRGFFRIINAWEMG